ncbi:PadR family transcriptional regulator [Solibacillus daqui]|uniref:PadR family transcriptional regulator n=1 Tax=Solibacillus daqui TaxID=2912187 RepID=UPI0023664B27|nr:PadR family transcriptional regulator [Solibacillus daqui]
MHQPLTEGIYYILLALYEPRHGYGIMQIVEEWSAGRVKLGAGTTYGALKNLQDKKYIETLAGEERKKEYVITQLGKEVVEMEVARLKELYDNGQKLIEAKGTK